MLPRYVRRCASITLMMVCVASPGWAQDGRAEARAELQDAKRQEQTILGRIEEIDGEIYAQRERQGQIADEISALEAQLARNRGAAETAQAALKIESEKISERVSALYRLQRSGTNRMVFGSEDPTELRRRQAYLMALIEAEVDRLQSYRDTVQETSSIVSLVEADRIELERRNRELDESIGALQAQRERRKDLLSEIRTKSTVALATIAEMDAARQDLQQRTASDAIPAQTSSSSRRPPPESAVSSSAPPKSFRSSYGRLRWPVAGTVINRYGKYTDENGQTVDSRGIDIEANYGEPVRVVFAGQVTLADYVRGYGQTVAVKHGQYTTIYAHLNGIRVRKGQQLDEGDVVGLVGNTGLTDGDGYMLTFEIRYNSRAQNPGPWLSPE
jgi:septal ring factor EnvC (AmiA/AmiB activator)